MRPVAHRRSGVCCATACFLSFLTDIYFIFGIVYIVEKDVYQVEMVELWGKVSGTVASDVFPFCIWRKEKKKGRHLPPAA